MALGVTHSALSFDRVIVEMTEVTNAAELLNTDLRNGETKVFEVHLDNSIFTSGIKAWVKFYDTIDTTFTGGTTQPIMILPVPIETSGDGNPVTGILAMFCEDGLEFEKGVSILASKEDGDTMTNPPDTQVDVRIIAS